MHAKLVVYAAMALFLGQTIAAPVAFLHWGKNSQDNKHGCRKHWCKQRI